MRKDESKLAHSEENYFDGAKGAVWMDGVGAARRRTEESALIMV